MNGHKCIRLGLLIVGVVASHSRASSVVPMGSYPVQTIYQSQMPGIGPIGSVTSGTTAAALVGNQVKTVALPGGPASAPLFTLPGTVGGFPAFAGGFAVSDGSHILTGQTGGFSSTGAAGELYLTPVAGGSTQTFAMDGNYDATVRGGNFYASGAHGTDAHGDTTGIYSGLFGPYRGSGIFGISRSGGSITGLDLLFDTGAYSGALAADPLTGDIYFALGGESGTLSGGMFNDLWVLKAADVAAAHGSGTISALSVDYVGNIGTGFDEFITGMDFDPSGALLVGLNGQFSPSGLDRIVRFSLIRSNPLDYSTAGTSVVAIGSDPTVRILDFFYDDGTLRLSAVPEPASLLLIFVGGVTFWTRRGRIR